MKNFASLFALALVISLLAGCAHAPAAYDTPKLKLLNQQIAANPKDAQAYSNRGYVLALLGRKAAARADLQAMLALKDTAPMHNRAGWAYFNNGDYETALKEFELAANRSERRSHYDYYSLVLGYWGVRDMKRAVENYALAVEREPKFGEAKTLEERTSEWTPLERRAMREVYTLWSKTWKPQ